MERGKVVEKLEGFGLTQYEAEVYFALVRFGPQSAKEISSRMEVPKNRVYGCVDSLEDRGFVDVIPGTPKKYDAVNPGTSLGRELELLKQMEQKLEDAFQKRKIKEESPLKVRYGRKSGVEARLSEFKKAEDTYSGIVGLKRITTQRLGMIDREVKNAVSRGVNIRFLLNMDYKENRDKAEKLRDYGAKYKHFPAEDFVCAIRDEKVVRVEIPHPEKRRTNIWIRNEDFAKKMQLFFDREWEVRS